MGDYTALQLYVALPKGLTEQVRDSLLGRISMCFADYGYNFWRGNELRPEGPDGDGDFGWGAEARCGAADDLHSALKDLVADKDHDGLDFDSEAYTPVPDFGWLLWEDPAYEWLGNLWLHIPGGVEYTAECDSNGTPLFGAENIKQILAAANDLDDVKQRVADQLGTDAFEAWAAYRKGQR